MEAVKMALKSIAGNKMRAFLTMLGIMIGVMSIVILVAIAQGTTSAVVSQIERMGTNLLNVTIRSRRNNPVTLSGLRELSGDESIAYVAPTLTASGTLKAGLQQYDEGALIGTTAGYELIRGFTVKTGRFITEPDLDNRSFVAVIGSEVATSLFSTTRAVSGTFTFNGYTFTVVGVLESVGSSVSGSGDNMVIIPFTLAERLFGSKGISSFYVSSSTAETVTQAENAITTYLSKLFSNSSSSYFIYNQSAMLETYSQTTQTLTIMLGGIAAISLLVGGIGIMNIMLVSVSERTREIGIRKAIGASRSSILTQFLVEALTVSLLGGMIGLALSVAAALFLAPALSLSISISPSVAALAILFSVLVGVVFGLYPANKASRLHPIDALRHE